MKLAVIDEREGTATEVPLRGGEKLEFTLCNGNLDPVKVWVWPSEITLFLNIEGHGYKTNANDGGHCLAVDLIDAPGNANVFIWDNIFDEEPVKLSLAGARVKRLLE